MRKRRRFANKIMTMVCAVLIAFSAFFYVPMEVSAETVSDGVTVNLDNLEVVSSQMMTEHGIIVPTEFPLNGPYYLEFVTCKSGNFDLYNKSLDMEVLYEVTVDMDLVGSVNSSWWSNFYSLVCMYGNHVLLFKNGTGFSAGGNFTLSNSVKFYAFGHELRRKPMDISAMYISVDGGSRSVTFDYDLSVNLVPVTDSAADSYVNGYNSGYQDGQSAGYGSGYSSGFSDGEDSGYNKGFDAGKDSVDTDSYYDSGYQAGENAGYNSGYQAGKDSVDTDSIYNSGYQAGKDSVDTDSIYNSGYQAGEDAGFDSGYQAGQDSIDTDSIYNSGYQAGESSGYDSGYQAGKDSVDTDSYYNSGYQAGESAGYQAGVDSVDTDAYYKAGYDDGYRVAYNEGFDDGYDVGYQNAMNRIDSWGADTSDYPLLVYDNFVSKPYFYIYSLSNVPQTSYGSKPLFNLDFDVNPHHTYKLVFDVYGFYTDASESLFSSCDVGFKIGNLRFSDTTQSLGSNTVFVEGSSLGSLVVLDGYAYQMRYYGGVDESEDFDLNIGYLKIGSNGNVSLKVYDMGPSGDTQNHIANQTDSLTNGFDNSQGNSVNSDLSSGLNEYQTSEDTLWATATTGLKDFTFFDFASVPAMITGMSFITAIMGSWFNQAGGASGVGIVLSILFSVVLVAMVLGLYRWYQSRGGKD